MKSANIESEKEKTVTERVNFSFNTAFWMAMLCFIPWIWCIWSVEEAFINTPDKLIEAMNTIILFASGWLVLWFLLIIVLQAVKEPLTLLTTVNSLISAFAGLTFNAFVIYLYLWNRFPDINEFEARFTLSISLFAGCLYISNKFGIGRDFREIFFNFD